MPSVSVVIPAHNRASTLPRAVRSALGQTHGDLEVLVVDDGSTDGTRDVARNFNDHRVHLHAIDSQRGANAARNLGVDAARGEFVSFLDSDDELDPPHLERVLEAFRSEGTGCAGVITACRLSRDGRVVDVSSPGDGLVSEDRLLDGDVPGGFTCATLRARVLDDVRLDEQLRSWQDRDLYLRLARLGHRLRGIDEPLATRHLGEARIGDDPERILQGTARFREKHGDVLSDRGLATVHYRRAFSCARAGWLPEARVELRKSLRADPTHWLGYLHLLAAVHPTTFRLLVDAKRAARRLARRLS